MDLPGLAAADFDGRDAVDALKHRLDAVLRHLAYFRRRHVALEVDHDDRRHRRVHRNDDGFVGIVRQLVAHEIEVVSRVDLRLVHVVTPVEFEHDDAHVFFGGRRHVLDACDRNRILLDGARDKRFDIRRAGADIRRHHENVGNVHVGIQIEL